MTPEQEMIAHQVVRDLVQSHKDDIKALAAALREPMASGQLSGTARIVTTGGHGLCMVGQIIDVGGQKYVVEGVAQTCARVLDVTPLESLPAPVKLRPPPAPPWQSARPWLKKKKGRP